MLIKPERPGLFVKMILRLRRLNRRQLLTTMGLGGGLIAGGLLPRLAAITGTGNAQSEFTSTEKSPMKKRRRPIPISMSLAHRRISGGQPAAEATWAVSIDGMVEKR